MLSEQGFLVISIVATVAVAVFGIIFGLLSGRSPSPLTALILLQTPE